MMINCKECGHQISDKAQNCPNCGCPVYVQDMKNLSSKPKKKKSLLRTLLKIYGIIIGVFLVFGVFYSESKPKSYIIPDIVGDRPTSLMLYTRSEDRSNKVDFNLETIEEFSSTVPEGYVISMNPVAGTSIREGDTLTLTISKGVDPSTNLVRINLAGKDLKSAKSDLVTAGFDDSDINIKYKYSKSVSKNVVISSSLDGKEIDKTKNYSVDLVVSKGSLQEEIDTLVSSAKSVSYDDLIRYPDKYKKQPIKLTLKVSDVELESFFGVEYEETIWGTYEDKTLILEDNRHKKEPNILENDTITVFGYSNGLSTVATKEKEYQGSLVLGFTYDKTTDSYHVPCVNIQYLEIK